MRLGRAQAALLLAALLALQSAAGAWWMHAGGFFGRPAPAEAAKLRAQTYEYLRTLRERGPAAVVLRGWTETSDHTALIPTVGAFVAAAVDDDVGVVTQWTTNALFTVLLAIGTYRLARQFVARPAAVGAVALMLFAPMIFIYPRAFYWQHPMTSLLPWALDALLRSEGLRRLKWAGLFGLLLGAATWAKAIAPMYVIASSVAAFVAGLKRDRRGAFAGAATATAAFLLVVGPWLATSWDEFAAYARVATSDVNTSGSAALNDRFSAARALYYSLAFVNDGVGPVFAALALIGGFIVVVRRLAARDARPRRGGAALAVDAALVYLLATFGQVAGYSQYLQLFAVHAALLIAIAADGSRRGRALWIAGGVAALTYAAWIDLRPYDRDRASAAWHGIEWGGTADHYLAPAARHLALPPRAGGEPWPVARFAEAMLRRQPEGEPWFWEVHPYLNYGNLQVEARKRGRSLRWLTFANIRLDAFTVRDSARASEGETHRIAANLGIRFETVDSVEILPGRRVDLLYILPR
jgi:hypothetical protein